MPSGHMSSRQVTPSPTIKHPLVQPSIDIYHAVVLKTSIPNHHGVKSCSLVGSKVQSAEANHDYAGHGAGRRGGEGACDRVDLERCQRRKWATRNKKLLVASGIATRKPGANSY